MVRRTLAALCLLLAAPAFAEEKCEHPALKSNPAFDKLKALVGTWESKSEHGTSKVTYKLVSNGSALVEDLGQDTPYEMVTVYTIDKDGVLATHYCGAGNQPRMRAAAAEGGTLKFTFVDATNVTDPKMPLMNGLVINLKDADHFTQEWNSKTDGKDEKMTFTYARVKK